MLLLWQSFKPGRAPGGKTLLAETGEHQGQAEGNQRIGNKKEKHFFQRQNSKEQNAAGMSR